MLKPQIFSRFEGLEGDWGELLRSGVGGTPFQSFEWQSTWLKHYGKGRSPVVLGFFEGKDLVGVMPFIRSRAPWRGLRPMGLGPSDYLHPLALPGYERAVAEGVLDVVQGMGDVDLVDLHQVRSDQALAGVAMEASEGKGTSQATCLQLDLPSSFDAYLGTLGKSLRYDVRKLEKGLFSSGRASFVEVGADQVGWGLDVLFDQHKKRWAKRHLPGAFLGRSIAFHREWAELAACNGWLRLSVLMLDGEAIGAIYAMAMGSACYFYQSGFDPEQKAHSPGTLLVAHTIRRAIEDGQTRFDFLRGDEPYKRRWKPQSEVTNYRFVLPAAGILGRAGGAWNRFGGRVEGRVRARLEGRGLF